MISRILICGLGSMGKRRIRLLRLQYPEIKLFGVDSTEERCNQISKLYGIQTSKDFYGAFQIFCPDAVFVCTPPLTHSDFVLHSLKKDVHTFSEINLSAQGYEKILDAQQKTDAVAFLSSTSLYKKEMEWIIQQTENAQAMSYRYHVGQYLPDWHPWEKYSDFFVANKETNAIREIMAIEFPWILKAFGKVVDYKVMKGRVSKLDLGYPDIFNITLKHEQGALGILTIDCVSIRAIRQLEVYSDECYYQWEGLPNTLKKYSVAKKKMVPVLLYDHPVHEDGYDEFISEKPYQEEVKAFFNAINKRSFDTKYSYIQDKETIELIDKIEFT